MVIQELETGATIAMEQFEAVGEIFKNVPGYFSE
jgi:hypothetical protein